MANFEVSASFTQTIFDVETDEDAEKLFLDYYPDILNLTIEEIKELNNG